MRQVFVIGDEDNINLERQVCIILNNILSIILSDIICLSISDII